MNFVISEDLVRRSIGGTVLYVNKRTYPRLLELDESADLILQSLKYPMSLDGLRELIGHDAIAESDLADFIEAAVSLNLVRHVGNTHQSLPVRPEEPQDSSGEKEIVEFADAKRIPVSTTIELTSRCNLKCCHCYLGGATKKTDCLSTKERLRIINEMIEMGCLWTSVTGGDPLLHPDFPLLYSALTDGGALVTVLTNGTTVTSDMVRLFSERQPFKVEVSIYGASEETYENVTRVRGSYKRFLKGLTLLAESGVPLELKGIMMTLNVHEFEAMKEIASVHGAFFRFTGDIFESLEGSDTPTSYRLPADVVAALDFSDVQRAAELVECDRVSSRPESTSLYQCRAGISCYHVSAEGNLHPCITDRSISFSLKENSLQEVWEELLPRAMDMHYSEGDDCYNCGLHGLCKNCPPKTKLSHRDRVVPVPFLCDLALARHNLASEGGA